MGIIQSIRRGLAKVVGARIREDILLDFDNEDEPDHRFYRNFGQGTGFRRATRDLRKALQDEQNKQAYKMYVENPFIRRLARMTAEFLVGNGVAVVSKSEQVQTELDAWWNDPVNNWEKRHYNLALEFPLYGEIVPERVVNVFTGRHRYNWLDPLFIANVVAHREFPCVPAHVDFWTSMGGGATVRADIINGVPEQPLMASKASQDARPLVYFFTANNLTGMLRGHSNYYPLFEWADVLDNASFTMGERMVILLTYVWHLKAQNLDPKTKKKYETLLKNANASSALITNPDVTLEAVSPNLNNADFTEGARYIRNLIAGAAGIPEHWLGEGGDVNRATATAMNMPTLRSFQQQQREYIAIVRTLAKENLASVAAKGRIPAEEVENFTVQVDPMNPADTGTLAGALGSLVGALSSAKMEGWISDNEAQQALRNILGQLVELDDDGPSAEDLDNTNLPNGVVAAMRAVNDAMRATAEAEDLDDAPDGNGQLSSASAH